jgi:hypothetical protein
MMITAQRIYDHSQRIDFFAISFSKLYGTGHGDKTDNHFPRSEDNTLETRDGQSSIPLLVSFHHTYTTSNTRSTEISRC